MDFNTGALKSPFLGFWIFRPISVKRWKPVWIRACPIVLLVNLQPGGRVLPYKGLMGTSGQPGYVFRDFCLKQGIDFIICCLNQGIDFINFCLNQGIDFINFCLKQL